MKNASCVIEILSPPQVNGEAVTVSEHPYIDALMLTCQEGSGVSQSEDGVNIWAIPLGGCSTFKGGI